MCLQGGISHAGSFTSRCAPWESPWRAKGTATWNAYLRNPLEVREPLCGQWFQVPHLDLWNAYPRKPLKESPVSGGVPMVSGCSSMKHAPWESQGISCKWRNTPGFRAWQHPLQMHAQGWRTSWWNTCPWNSLQGTSYPIRCHKL